PARPGPDAAGAGRGAGARRPGPPRLGPLRLLHPERVAGRADADADFLRRDTLGSGGGRNVHPDIRPLPPDGRNEIPATRAGGWPWPAPGGFPNRTAVARQGAVARTPGLPMTNLPWWAYVL